MKRTNSRWPSGLRGLAACMILLVVAALLVRASASSASFEADTKLRLSPAHPQPRSAVAELQQSPPAVSTAAVVTMAPTPPPTAKPTAAPTTPTPTTESITSSPLPASVPPPPSLLPSTTPPTPAPTSSAGCREIQSLLLALQRGNDSTISTHGLPKPFVYNEYGFVFSSKTPVLRTLSPTTGAPAAVLLRYNKDYNTAPKYANSLSILTEFSGPHSSQLLPQLFAHCDDAGDGFSYLLEENLPLHPIDLANPSNFSQCVQRMKDVVGIFETLDEDLHLCLLDVKKGQWMARNDSSSSSFVLPDVDDVVRSPFAKYNANTDLYADQVARAKLLLMERMPNGTTAKQMDRYWTRRIFPHGFTIRYVMILLRILVEQDLGLDWRKDCSASLPGSQDGFMPCVDHVLQWAATPHDDWPAPRQVVVAIEQCHQRGTFARTRREPAAWRDGPSTH